MDILHRKQMTALSRFFGQIVELYTRWAKKEGISYNKLAVIMTIFENEQATQRKICLEWGLPKQTVSTICKSFEQDGLITYSIGADDSREKYMTLTAKGKEYFEPMVKKLHAVESYALQKIGQERMAIMLQSMDLFTKAFGEGVTEVKK